MNTVTIEANDPQRVWVGTDAGGSTRIPAACNGVIGLKQSAGVVPHDMSPEVFANVSSINPMARTVMDTALMLEAMAGQHPSDPYSYGVPATGFVAAAKPEGSLEGMRIAWRPLLANTAIDGQVLEACESAAMSLGALGACVEPVDDGDSRRMVGDAQVAVTQGLRALRHLEHGGATVAPLGVRVDVAHVILEVKA